jgi:hypothetical protein
MRQVIAFGGGVLQAALRPEVAALCPWVGPQRNGHMSGGASV